MRDKTHAEFIERWSTFMKNNPDRWKPIHTQFIDAQLEKAQEFIRWLSKQPGGKEKIRKLYNITNKEACKQLLSYGGRSS